MRNLLGQRIVLLVSASPPGLPHLRVDREARDIRGALTKDRVRLEVRQAVRLEDLQQALSELSPEIVHFSGHGTRGRSGESASGGRDLLPAGKGELGMAGLVLEDGTDGLLVISQENLMDLFEVFKNTVECVVLNACYTDVQAELIARHIPYVVGMDGAVLDDAAIAFAVGFYGAFGAGMSIPDCWRLGKIAASTRFPGETVTAQMKTRGDIAARAAAHGGDRGPSPPLPGLRDMADEEVARRMRQLIGQVGSPPDDGELCRAIGVLALRLQQHDIARRYLRCAIDLESDRADGYYLFALALFRGQRTGDLTAREVREIERKLQVALELDGDRSHYFYALALLKAEARLYTSPQPTAGDLFRTAATRRYDPEEIERLLAAVPVADPGLLDLVRRGGS
jgi:hypothetical protein